MAFSSVHGPQRGYFGFHVTGMLKGIFWGLNFWFREFLGYIARSSMKKVQPIRFLEIVITRMFGMGILRGLIFGRGISLGFVGSPRYSFVFWFLSPFVIPVTWNLDYPLPLEQGRKYKYILLRKGVFTMTNTVNICYHDNITKTHD